METKVWHMRDHISEQDLAEIKGQFEASELVVIPTETVYGLGGNACSDEAVKRIYEAKGRPSDNPLIVHIHSMDQLGDFVQKVSPEVQELMRAFWPGPISFILPLKAGYLCERVTGGLNSIAVRMPSHPVGRRILQYVNLPIAAPSANLSGRPSPTMFQHAFDDLNGRVAGIVNGDQSEEGLESTVLDCTTYPFQIARPGAITKKMIETVLPHSVEGKSGLKDGKPIAPGMKYKHYAPDTPVTVLTQLNGPIPNNKDWQHIAFAVPQTLQGWVPKESHFIPLCDDEEDMKAANHNLYRILHDLDSDDEITSAYIYGFTNESRAEAYMNRLMKAANQEVVTGDEL
ncbi:L-threonylcarbamoyladenylate synthase [Staphylococcus argensis]|uniref:Threonylcarbamoyl-AMP synthase n=1 Tax=Staphylococcus argensis TaxID=1607738 RepID=A0A2K4FA01_9STAP|nr:L-threonylcarbamoyladenylate synthase [Staphylococcus argensis]MCY6990155.1 L-threonylcarbamoyladenylate synthase [Staphylococcus argensis]POA08103.1 threonylcarbamoyl-AMP synthase [Staphylococcus argensis]